DRVFYGDNTSTIRIYDPNGALLNDSLIAGLGDNPPLAFGQGKAWGNDLYTVNQSNGQLLRIKSDGNTSVIGTNFGEILDITFGADGAMYLSDFTNDRILRIAPSREAQGLHPGENQVIVAASDGYGGVAYQSYLVCVLPAEGNRPPVFLSVPITAF